MRIGMFMRAGGLAVVTAATLALSSGVAYASGDGWSPGELVVFPGGETARVDNSGATVTFDLGSEKPWGDTIPVGDAADLGAERI
jgi:hypothetical protein